MTTTFHAGIEPRNLGALKALYIYTIIGAGVAGVWSLFAPMSFAAALGVTNADPYTIGVSGAVDTAFAICAALGLRAPARFVPVFFLQLIYKALWLAVAFAPRALHGAAPAAAWAVAIVFASYVVFDLLVLPLAQLTAEE